MLIEDPRPLRLRDLADDPRSVGRPTTRRCGRSWGSRSALGQVYGNLYLTEKADGGDFDADDERALILLAAQAGAAVGNAYLYEEATTGARRLEAVRAITIAILAGTEPGELLALVVRQARGCSTPTWPPWPCPRTATGWPSRRPDGSAPPSCRAACSRSSVAR